MLVHHITLVSFRLFPKNLGNLREFLDKWFTVPPGKKLPVRLCLQENLCGGSFPIIITFTPTGDPFSFVYLVLDIADLSTRVQLFKG